MDIETFFDMGGYAWYVWSAYGLALAVLLINLATALRRSQRVTVAVKRLARQQVKAR